MRRQLEKVRRDLEAACSKGSRDACATSKQAAAGADELAREVAALTALFPEPTRAEAALLDEYADRLRAAAEDPEGAARREDPRRRRRRGRRRQVTGAWSLSAVAATSARPGSRCGPR